MRHLGQVSVCHMTCIMRTGSLALRTSQQFDDACRRKPEAPARFWELFMIDLTIRESARNVIVASLLTLVVIGSAIALALG